MTEQGNTPPHDLEAEAALLGSMMLTAEARETAYAAGVTAGDFYKPAHAVVYTAIVATDERNERDGVDPMTVGAELARRNLLDGLGGRAALLRLMAATPASANATGYARIVRAHARARRIIGWAGDVADAGYQAIGDDFARVDTLFEQMDGLIADAPIGEHTDAIDVLELLQQPPPVPKPWVIPGLIRVGEVLVLTGGEGAGKMSLLRQMVMGAASGVHPFTGQFMERQSGLIVDLQEDRTDLRGELAKRQYEAFTKTLRPGYLHTANRRGGINLLSPHDARRFEGLLVKYEPRLVVMGPLKRIYQPPPGHGIWDDSVVEELHAKLDRWMDRYGFALCLEGHAGHDREVWRVKGSSAWYAWPHFGYGLDPTSWHPRECRMVRWRGDRNPDPHPRCWPTTLTAGTSTPWEANQEAIDAMRRAHDRGNELDQLALADDEAPF